MDGAPPLQTRTRPWSTAKAGDLPASPGAPDRTAYRSQGAATGRVAFLFLGEMLLIPHLYPIAETLFGAPDVQVDLWTSTHAHEALLGGWSAGRPNVRVRRAPLFRRRSGREPLLTRPPAKLPMLLALLPELASADVVVCAEQTSLWLPHLFPLRTRFVKTSHGVGSMSARDDPRRRAPALTLVPSERERRAYLARGFDPARIVATGYVKAGFRQRTGARPRFPEARPIVLYAPHWQRHRSSWWRWGPEAAERVAADGRYNLIFAPHQRLVERAPEVRAFARDLSRLPNVRCDLDSFAMVDGSYTDAADLYLGDTSSQVVEFLARPRPCVFLNAGGAAWRGDPDYAQWEMGEVVDDLRLLPDALTRAQARHAEVAERQRRFAADSLGDVSGQAAEIAARWIARLLPGTAPSATQAPAPAAARLTRQATPKRAWMGVPPGGAW
jgi:hypothetical protein